MSQAVLAESNMASEIKAKNSASDVELSCIEEQETKVSTAYTLQTEEKDAARSAVERRLLLKQDLLILPLLALIYFVTFLVRSLVV
jgi:hypothetical protein